MFCIFRKYLIHLILDDPQRSDSITEKNIFNMSNFKHDMGLITTMIVFFFSKKLLPK